MNHREKLLSGLVALLALIAGTYFVWNRASAALAQRHSALANLRKQTEEQDRLLNQAAKAKRTLADLQKRSLPVDQDRANTAYQDWLLHLVVWLDFRDPSVKIAERSIRGKHYTQSRFEVDAYATLEQLVEFLTTFYSSGDLHRIKTLTVKPIAGSRELDIGMAIETISLPGSQRTTVGDVTSTRLAGEDVQEMQDTILNRSLFFPANQPPKLEPITNQRVVRGTPMRVPLKATDPDTWDLLAFSLLGEAPEGVEIKPRGVGEAELSWSPRDNGEYSIELEVHDDGFPRQAHKTSIKVSVVDPPPIEVAPSDNRRRIVGFDDATQTYLVGITVAGDQREAWFSVRTTGQLLKLSPGAKLDVGSILGELSLIDDRFVEISTPDGVVRVEMDKSLSEAIAASPSGQRADSGH